MPEREDAFLTTLQHVTLGILIVFLCVLCLYAYICVCIIYPQNVPWVLNLEQTWVFSVVPIMFIATKSIAELQSEPTVGAVCVCVRCCELPSVMLLRHSGGAPANW